MPKQTKESRFAVKLRELGFKPAEYYFSSEDIQKTDKETEQTFGVPVPHKLSRADRRKLIAEGILPSFAVIGSWTQAFDELGHEWWARGIIDLISFGFSDNVAEVAKLRKKSPQRMN